MAALALAAPAAVAATGPSGNAFDVALSPGAPDGDNGWYRSNVTATYTCTPAGGWVLSSQCGAPGGAEIFGNGTVGPLARSATFTEVLSGATETVPLSIDLKVDTAPPPAPTLTTPVQSRIYDAGSLVLADYACAFTGELSGASPTAPCTGAVPAGQAIYTGTADVPGSWGRRPFSVVARDAAGNTSTRSVTYNVDELPGAPAPVTPADRAEVPKRPVLTWQAPADDGSGFSLYRVRVTPQGQATRTYEVRDARPTVTWTVPADLPLGAAAWDVSFVDARARSTTSPARTMRILVKAPPAAPVVTLGATTGTDPRPVFAWQPAEPGGTFDWQVLNAAGQIVQGPANVATPTVRVPQPLSAGAYTFRVRQLTDVGGAGEWAAVPFGVVATPSAPPATVNRASRILRPQTRNATRLSPRPGARVNLRPTLRWPRARGASLYNVQVFRIVGRRYVKVLTSFPRSTRLTLPKGKLRSGSRYVWRVWPYVGATRRYTKNPLGVSYFDARR